MAIANSKLAVFDFDHTITSIDTSAGFFIWLIRRNIGKLAIVLLALPLLGPLLLVRKTQKIPLRFGAWIATFWVSNQELQPLARTHVEYMHGKGYKFVRTDALAQINLHIEQGNLVVIATGSLEVLAIEILLAEGLAEVKVVGSTVRQFLGGMIVKAHCFGDRKIPMLQARGFSAPFAFAYSDHEADLPLLISAEQRYIVNPKRRSAEILSAELRESGVVLKWN